MRCVADLEREADLHGPGCVDLGDELLGDRVDIDLTMTSPTCPMGEMIEDDARRAVEAVLPEGMHVGLHIVWNPPWSPEFMSDAARRHFGWDGD